MLSNKQFQDIIKLTPLIALDLIIYYKNKILLGRRINEPAKGFFFIPGGRILKGETLEKSCLRLTKNELGFTIPLNKFTFHMNTQHIYKNNFFNNNFSTHYICLCYKYELNDIEYKKINIDQQHDDILWLTQDKMLKNDLIHINTKNYFINNV